MKVCFAGGALTTASTRYRVIIPAMALQKLGVEITKDADILVYGKTGVYQDVVDRYPFKVYDVCDDNFDCSMRGEESRRHVATADIVTCNSEVMRFIIHKKCGRIATVIPDPYEHDEWKPSWGEGLLWFGHQVNVKDLIRVLPKLEQKVHVITSESNKIEYTEWSPQAVDDGLRKCAVVILPTGRAIGKSANRLIESVRAGKCVVAEPLPCYEEFSPWVWVGDMAEGVKWVHEHQEAALARIQDCQNYIRWKYSPERIGAMWLRVLTDGRH